MNPNIIYMVTMVCCIVQISCLNKNFPRVETPFGKIKGYYKFSYKRNLYEAYEGIPYAEPPTGNRRFEPPELIKPWVNELDATKKPNKCIQYEVHSNRIVGFEDCLYLNIYVPVSTNTTLFPVIVFIHGGGFQFGYSIKNQPTHLIDRNLTLVTINYRLGPFGFLSTGDEVVPGNMGLKDQNMALRWISKNIKYFGGDPKRVTIMGCSAGAASVHYHYLSPMSVGLFQNGISSSGSALSTWAYTENPLDEFVKLVKLMKCNTNNTVKSVCCLKKIPAPKLAEAIKTIFLSEYFFLGIGRVIYQPVAEKTEKNYFINKSPREILKNKDFYDVPWIAGVSSAEGLAFTSGFLFNKTLLSILDENWKEIGPYLLMFNNSMSEYEQTKIANLSRNHYFGNLSFEVNDEFVQKMINLSGDKIIRYDAQKSVKMHATVSQSPVHFYYFDYNWNKSNKYGVIHCDDCNFIFRNDDFDPTIDLETTLMLERSLDFLYSVVSGSDSEWRRNWPKVVAGSEYVNYAYLKGPKNITYIATDNFSENKFWKNVGM